MTKSPRKPRRLLGRLQPMNIRPLCDLLKVRDQHGSAFLAAINGAVNAEEFLKLDQISEH